MAATLTPLQALERADPSGLGLRMSCRAWPQADARTWSMDS